MSERERMMWRGMLVTVIERKLRTVEIRDPYGFVWTVRKRDLVKLPAEDDRRTFGLTE